MKKNKKLYLFSFTPILVIFLILGNINYLSNHYIFARVNNIGQTILASNWDENKIDYHGNTNITVDRSPSCGCCGGWIGHIQKQGFEVTEIKTNDMETIKQKYNLPSELTSCHTAIIDNYVMEGHIPADDIKRFLAQKPADLKGLTVPAMPIGTPGMESDNIKQAFKVLAFNHQGETNIFKSYEKY